ncbi:MAG: alpha/beta hydrolase-fold protein, partial [Hyphomonadaceae bacterium]|nr:alpha/beta hydrolase-fold protein [Hyphomonadaceae bacterium]
MLTSARTGRTYQIFVAYPAIEAPDAGFPIIYMTDANIRFGAMVDITRAHARGSRGDPEAHAILVGIGYPDGMDAGVERAVDLTPALGDMPTPEGFGGAADFLHFVLEDLKPEIETRYPVNKDREALFGHSFGGLFALHTLINQPDAFDTYLVSSPSIWWGERFLHQARSRLLPRLQATGAQAKAFVSVGELEQSDTPPAAPPAGRPV